MASATAAIHQAASPKKLDASLWWDSFVVLFDELGNAPLASPFPESLAKKIQDNHWWFKNNVSGFKVPNRVSRLALDSPRISIGEHQLPVDADLKEVALTVSSILNLDEVQSYILLHRCDELQNLMSNFRDSNSLHLILVQYYLERRCILKCIRSIFTHALYMGKGSCEADIIRDQALQLVKEGLEDNLLHVIDSAISASHSEKTEVDVVTLWVEEYLLEHNLVLDILFLVYYDNFCTCSPQQWKKLCVIFVEILSGSLHIGKLAVSAEARSYFYYMKVQLLLILIECLNLEDLLRKVYDEVSFRDGCSAFSVTDVQDIDAIISNLIPLEAIEAGPLVLSWAVFLCLLQSLPDRQGCNMLSEIDHVGYVQEATQVAPFNYLVEVLNCDLLKDSEGPVSAFLSVLRTFVSSFISAYEIKYQHEDDTLSLILEILFLVYRGEETLCMQFWDRDSFVDGPIRSLLHMLENEFPFHLVEFIRMLSSLCEGAWSAECVYNFLDNLNGVTLSYVIPNALNGVNVYDIIETPHALHIPGFDGFVIPSKTRGQVLKLFDEKTVLVRWQHAQSGVLLLILRLTQEFHSINYDELDPILDLLYRLIYFNKVVCFTLFDNNRSLDVKLVNGHTETATRIDFVKVLSLLVCNLFDDFSNTRLVTMCINILGEMIKCSPSHVCETTLKTNFFGLCDFDSSSDAWFLSRGLAGMLLVDCEKNVGCILTISVLDYAIRLIEVGDESSLVSSLVVFSVQHVLVNHENWKYKLKSDRWKVTLKVFDVMKKCIEVMESSSKHGLIVRDILLNDSSVQNVLSRIMCITSRNLESMYVSRLYETKEIDGLQLAIASALDIILYTLKEISELENTNPDVPMLVQKMLFSNVKPVPTFAASLISFFHDSGIQLSATRVLSLSFQVASRVQTPSFEKISLVGNDVQFEDLVTSIVTILDGDIHENEDLIVSVVDLLVAAAHYQPLVFVNIISFGMNVEEPPNNTVDQSNQLAPIHSLGSLGSKKNIIASILRYVNRSTYLVKSAPRLLLCILNFLKGLWEAGGQYTQILDIFRSSESFWNHLSTLIPQTEVTSPGAEKLDCDDDTLCFAGYRYQCHAAIFEIMAHDILFLGKMSHMLSENQTSKNSIRSTQRSSSGVLKGAMICFTSWDTMESIEDLESLLQASRSPQGRSLLASKNLVPSLLEKISSSIHLITCLRLLRNLCAGEIANQNSFIRYGGVEVIRSTLLSSELLETSVPLEVIHVGLQLLGNVVAAGEEHRCAVWSHFFGYGFFELATITNDGVCDPLCMILYLCCCSPDGARTRFRMVELLGDEVRFSIVPKIIRTACSVGHHGDWLVLLISRLCFEETCFPKFFSELSYFHVNKRCSDTEIGKLHFTKEQTFLLNILSENLSEESYKGTISNIFTSTILQVLKDASSIVDFTSRGVSALPTTIPANDILGFSLNILKDLCTTNEPPELLLSTDLCNTLLELLRELEPPTIIRRPHCNGENAQQAPSLNTIATISGKVCPYKGYRRDLVATIGNSVFGKRHIQDEIRRQDGILLLLQQCVTDDDNPFLREWAIWTLRNLLEGNLENQKVVAELEVQEPVNSSDISAMGFRVEVDQKSRRAKLVNLP